MEHNQVSHVIKAGTSAAAHWTADRYRAEAARRRKLRAERRPLVTDARRALAVARKADPERTKPGTHKAERELAAAKRAVPDPMWLFASKAVVLAAVAGYVGLPHVPSAVWLWSAVAVAVAAVGAVVVAVAASGRKPKGLAPTAEERQLLKRLAPEHWREHAEGRGLAGTLTGTPKLTDAGIVTDVRLDGTWTAGKLRAAADHVRSLLGCRAGLRMEIKAGDRGGWAVITLRTRSAADGDDLKWSPSARTFGVDTVTGEHVTVPLGERLLIAGRSGAGKSVASRPLLFDASEGDTNALVIIDLKMVEGRLWDHRARVESTPEGVVDVVAELADEMRERLALLPKGQATWTPTPERPRLTVVVDEGAEVVTAAKDALEGLETLARMGRAACIDLWWMTQKPTIGDGIPKQIAPQISTAICLAVRTPAEARVVLGEDAQAKGWLADELPAPGVAFVRDGKRKPNPINVRYMDDSQVIALPDQSIWRGPKVAPVISMRKPPEPPATPAAAESSDARVLRIVQDGPARQKDIAERTGLSKGAVSKVVARLVAAGRLVRLDDGTVSAPARTEATA
ncbi:MarR family transcriptional regulator [Streptomyces sp. NPDC057115]|uniref:helix-turn-helix transcriptional regulator n=1 Tax=Streptomyces sp. NPDC057115 TaxID=3346022 RepID=UPI0036253B91